MNGLRNANPNQRRALAFAPAFVLLIVAMCMPQGCTPKSNLYGDDPPPQENPNS